MYYVALTQDGAVLHVNMCQVHQATGDPNSRPLPGFYLTSRLQASQEEATLRARRNEKNCPELAVLSALDMMAVVNVP